MHIGYPVGTLLSSSSLSPSFTICRFPPEIGAQIRGVHGPVRFGFLRIHDPNRILRFGSVRINKLERIGSDLKILEPLNNGSVRFGTTVHY